MAVSRISFSLLQKIPVLQPEQKLVSPRTVLYSIQVYRMYKNSANYRQAAAGGGPRASLEECRAP